MRVILLNRLLLLTKKVFTASSEILATLHPLKAIQSGHVRRSLSLNAVGSDSAEGNKTLQDLLQEMQSIGQGVTSAIEDIEVTTDGNPVAMIQREMKRLKQEISSTQVSAVEVSQAVLQEVKALKAEVSSTKIALTHTQDLLRDSFKMRRIEFAILHHKLQKVLDPDSLEALDLRGFTQLYDSDGKLCGLPFDFNSFVVSTLYGFLGNEGVRLPDVVYYGAFSYIDKHERLQVLKDEDDDSGYGTGMFHKITVSHIHLLLGSKPRIESNGGKTILFFDWD